MMKHTQMIKVTQLVIEPGKTLHGKQQDILKYPKCFFLLLEI